MGDTATTRWQVPPDLPLRPAAFYRTLNPVEIGMHLMRTWSPLGTRAFMLIVAWGIWEFAAPDLAKAESLAVGWMAQIWIRNIVLVAVIAGGKRARRQAVSLVRSFRFQHRMVPVSHS